MNKYRILIEKILCQDKAKKVDDAGHQRGFLTQYWGKIFHQNRKVIF